jgi:hypothetical protein
MLISIIPFNLKDNYSEGSILTSWNFVQIAVVGLNPKKVRVPWCLPAQNVIMLNRQKVTGHKPE